MYNRKNNNRVYRQAIMRKTQSKWQSVYDELLVKLKKEKVSIESELTRMKVVRQDLYLWMTEEQKLALKVAKMSHATYRRQKPRGAYYRYSNDEAVLIKGKLVDVSQLKKAA